METIKIKILLNLLLCFVAVFGYAQQNKILEKPKVDKRVEILSIVFRLADCKEYSANVFELYTDKVEKHYKPYKNHELIKFIKKIRYENGIGYDAVMRMAVHLDTNLNPVVNFTDEIPSERWGKEKAIQFVKLLKRFYRDSKSEEFFRQNTDFYAKISQKFQPVYESLDVDWYTSFYGKEPAENFYIINALGNGGGKYGGGNYGVSVSMPNQKRQVYAIMGTWIVDESGMAEFPLFNYLTTLLHEFNHTFVNYFPYDNPKPFEESGKKIYECVKDKMQKQAYRSWETMLNEALVRAAVIKYMKDNDFPKEKIRKLTNIELKRGFIWIEDLVAELEEYDKQRKEYPTLESYLPNIVKAYEKYAKKMTIYMRKTDNKDAE